ncbi:MAG: efflux RND transporter periplasmic adaptor subunit [Bacteroides sp.]
MRIPRIARLALYSLGFFALLPACSNTTPRHSSNEAEQTLDVRVALVSSARVEDSETFSATVDAFEVNHVCPAIAGRIDAVLVDVGDHVTAGQLLVQMDETQLLTSRAQLLTLERDLARLDTLRSLGSVTQQQYDQLHTQVEVARAQVSNLQKNTRLTAPIAGVVTGRYFHPGELFTMSPTPESGGRSAIITLMQINPVKVKFNLPEGRLSALKVGQPVSVTLDAYPNATFQGSVYRIAPTVHALSHTVEVQVQVPNPQLQLKPGMFARMNLSFGEVDRLLVPDLAIVQQRGTNDRAVFIAHQGKALRKIVKLGNRQGEYVEILDGLRLADSVITTGLRFLQDGHAIRVLH